MQARDGPQNAPLLGPTDKSFLGPTDKSIVGHKSPDLRNSRKVPVSRAKSTPKTNKLQVTKSRQAGQECWTVKAGKRGEKKADFRVRRADSGYRVVITFRDTDGARRERYCCYLSAEEWLAAKRGSLAGFASLVGAKVEARYASGDIDAARYQEIAPRIGALT